jgi:DNA adenine methylase
MKPFLKWVGGKTQILQKVLDEFPREIHGDYYEPFLGGGSILIGLLSSSNIKIHGRIIASDLNKTLILTFINIRDNLEQYTTILDEIINEYNSISSTVINRKAETCEEGLSSKESYYYWKRREYNTTTDLFLKSVLFLFLNKTSFRGVYREGPNGYNVPYGHPKSSLSIYSKKHLQDISTLIQNVEFKWSSYEDALVTTHTNDFVYLDPPYLPINTLSFVSYNASGFSLNNHKHLFDLIKMLKSGWLMSNANVSILLEDVFKDYTIKTFDCRRSIHSSNPGSTASEVLIKSDKKM